MKFENIGSGDNPNDDINWDYLIKHFPETDWEALRNSHRHEDDDEPYYIMECSMCGKETAHRECGMCPHCEQVWNG